MYGVVRFFTLGYSLRIAVAYCSVIRIMLEGMLLLFSDNCKSYDDRGVFVVAGAASLCDPSPFYVWPPHTQLPGSPTIDLENELSLTIYHLLAGRPAFLCTGSLLGFSERRTSAPLDSVESSPS